MQGVDIPIVVMNLTDKEVQDYANIASEVVRLLIRMNLGGDNIEEIKVSLSGTVLVIYRQKAILGTLKDEIPQC